MNCSDWPSTIDRRAGVTAIDTRLADVTVRFALPDTAPNVAVIFAVPAPTAEASPPEVEAMLTVATAAFDELH